MSFIGFFSIFSSGGHFVQGNRTIFAILVESPKEHFCEIIWPARICHLKVFLFLALAAILFSGLKPF